MKFDLGDKVRDAEGNVFVIDEILRAERYPDEIMYYGIITDRRGKRVDVLCHEYELQSV